MKSTVVITSLAEVGKELVENALDAKATLIQLNVLDYGLEKVECSDNGTGISTENRSLLAQPHATSKIRGLEEVYGSIGIRTFGFRGEALSSICRVSGTPLKVHTATSSPSSDNSHDGAMLTFDASGTLIHSEPKARTKGTTIIIESLFTPLPVRRRTLERQKAAAFRSLLTRLEPYALMARGIRLVVKHNGKNVMDTGMGDLWKQRVMELYGPKQSRGLLSIDHTFQDITFKGLFSKPNEADARRGGDRQFLYINQRPIVSKPITRTLNRIYRGALGRKSGFPFFLLSITAPPGTLDVNMSTDKTQVAMQGQDAAMDAFYGYLETALEEVQRDTMSAASMKPHVTYVPFEPIARRKRSVQEVDDASLEAPLPMEKKHVSPLRLDVSVSTDEVMDVSVSTDEVMDVSVSTDEVMDVSVSTDEVMDVSVSTDEVMDVPVSTDEVMDVPVVSSPLQPEETVQDLLSIGHDSPSPVPSYPTRSSSMQQLSLDAFVHGSTLSHAPIVHPTTPPTPHPSSHPPSLSKEDFEKMHVIGQFNKGFILTYLEDKVYIIDQHAADEKYRYETLCQKRPLCRTQSLLEPLSLQDHISSTEEDAMIQHAEEIRRHGFRLEIDENAMPKSRVRISGVPVHQNHQFGMEDALELLETIQKGVMDEKDMIWPKMKDVLASKACRSSVMIGTDLNQREMIQIVRHLGSLDHPWACPHGRPTIRFLCTCNGS